MLFKLSLKNISKSIKDYAIYFFTLILGVAIFYVFNAIDDQSVMMKVSSTTAEIIKLMTNVLSGVSVFVSIILAFLIVYASRFLIKRRNKEFGVYLTLGMSKKKISLILFIETLIIGIVSLVVGLGIGFLLSQLMSILVANMFEADLTRFQFVFSTNACIKTLIYFSIMYFVVMIFNTINISKCKLIDLMHSNKKSEKIKLKNPLFCTIVFIISCIALGFAYYQVTGGIEKMTNANSIFVPIGVGAISTESFRGGEIWTVIVSIHNALVGFGYGLLVLFFAMGVFRSAASFRELQRPEFALRHFIRFLLAKVAVGSSLELITAIYKICGGVVSTVMGGIGSAISTTATLPDKIVEAIEDVSFLESIPLWLVSLLGSLLITILSYVLILTVYGRFFKIFIYTAIAPLPLASFAGEVTSRTGQTFLKSYVGVCMEGAVIVLSCVIYSAFLSGGSTALDESLPAVTMVWQYIGQLMFNMLVLTGLVKGSDRLVHEMLGA